MTIVGEVSEWLESIAPKRLSAEWDNTGLLLGDGQQPVHRIMTCLTLTPASVQEAIEARADLVISHHPLPFRAVKSITTSEPVGRLLWQLACAKISIYCPHTAWDSADDGVNAQIAKRLGLLRVQPLVPETCATPDNGSGALGVGRFGELSQTHSMAEVANLVSQQIPHCRMRGVDCGTAIRRIGIVCGSGGSLLSTLLPHRCELFLTGEATFHQCLEAEAAGVSMLLIGHFASEKFAMDELARRCGQHFSAVRVWGSEHERDPVRAFPFEN